MTDRLWLPYGNRVSTTPYHVCNIAARSRISLDDASHKQYSNSTAAVWCRAHVLEKGRDPREEQTAAILDATI